MNENLVYSTIDASILVQIITGIIAIQGLFIKLAPMHRVLNSVLGFEMIVQVIQLFFYIFFVRNMFINNMGVVRYYDWFITTPVMLITSMIYYKYQEYIEKFENDKKDSDKKIIEEMTFINFLKEYRNEVLKVVFFNFLMLLFGYLGETGQMDKMLAFYLGTIAFLIGFYIIYQEFAKKSKRGSQLFSILFIVWSIYGIAYLFSPVYKNTMFNGLDIISKNFFGLYLYYIIKNKQLFL